MQNQLHKDSMEGGFSASVQINEFKKSFSCYHSILQVKALKVNPRTLPANNLFSEFLKFKIVKRREGKIKQRQKWTIIE